MKKKILALTLAFVLALSLAACEKTGKQGKAEPAGQTDEEVTAGLLIERGIPRDKTMYYKTTMSLESVITVPESDDSSVSGDVNLNVTLTANVTSDPVNKTSCTDGMMNIVTYGMDMDYPMLTYSKEDVVWEQDPDTQRWSVSVDPNYVTNKSEGGLGLTLDNFKRLEFGEDGKTYSLSGELDLDAPNPVTAIISDLAGHSTPDIEVGITFTFDKATLELSNLTIRTKDAASNAAGDFTLNKFEYVVEVEKFDDKPLVLPADLPEPDRTEKYVPDLSDGIEVLEPVQDDGSGDLVFVIPSDLSEE